MKDKNNNRLQTVIGIFAADLIDAYQGAIWQGIKDRAEKLGVGLICFAGARIDSPQIPEATANVAYELGGKCAIDGLIVLTSAITSFLDQAGIEKFFKKHKDIPLVSIGVDVPGYSSILVDGSEAMTRLIEHLVADHGRRKFAIISGPEGHEEAEDRITSIKKVFNKYNLQFSKELCMYGNFDKRSGVEALKSLLERGTGFDTLVCLNDTMALGALEVLQENGIRVPEDLSLVGFDNIEESQYCMPPLTTVNQPLFDVGSTAVDEIIRQFSDSASKKHILHSVPLIRETCGCTLATSPPIEEIRGNAGKIPAPDKKIISHLYNLAVNAENDEFINILKSELTKEFIKNGNLDKWYNYIIYIADRLAEENGENSTKNEKINEMINEAIILTGKIQKRFQVDLRLRALRQEDLARLISISLAEAFEISVMLDRLLEGLNELGFHEVLLAVFDGDQSKIDKSRLLISLDRMNAVPLKNIKFDTRLVVPEEVDISWRKKHWIIKPLVFQDEPLGYLMLPADRSSQQIYDTLSKQLATTLKGALLLEQVHGHEKSLEEIVNRRTNELIHTNKMLTKEIERRIRLEQEVIDISNQTMDRIGQDLHDDLCQHLAGASMLTTALRHSLEEDSPDGAKATDNINSLIVESIDRAKRIARGLISSEIKEQGLHVSIDALVEAVRKSYNVNILFNNKVRDLENDPERDIQIYRIIQEALMNSVKHSGCSRIEIILYRNTGKNSADGRNFLVAEVSDDGCGLSGDISGEGMGLKIMRYRAEKANADLIIEQIKPGTRVLCRIRQ